MAKIPHKESVMFYCLAALQLSFNLESDISVWENTQTAIPFGASFFYILSVLELVVYTPLTYYLEEKHNHDRLLAKGIDKTLKANQPAEAEPAT